MSIQLEIVKNQPLGWSIPSASTECVGCITHEYCSPILFTQNTLDTNWMSDPISFQGRYLGDVQGDCDIMPNLQNAIIITIPEEPEGPIVSINESDISIQFPSNSSDVEFVQFLSVMDIGCFYSYSIVVTVSEESAPGTLELNENTYDIVPGQSFSALAIVNGSLEQTLNIVTSAEVVLDIKIVSATSTCNLQPNGIKVNGATYGTISVLTNTFQEFGEYVYQALSYKITITNAQYNEIKGKCGELILEGSCCCDFLVESECVRVLNNPCHTVGVEFWQSSTETEPALAFGFIYPAGPSASQFKQFMRVWGEVRNPQYDGEVTTYEDSLGTKSVVYAESREFRSFIVNYSPEYVHNALRLACRHQNFVLTDTNYGINAENFYTRSETYSPTWIRISKLAPVTIEVEKRTQTTIGGSSKTFCS